MTYDDWKASGHHEDLPTVCEEACDLGGCTARWAWETDLTHGPRKLRLCEHHAKQYLLEVEDVA